MNSSGRYKVTVNLASLSVLLRHLFSSNSKTRHNVGSVYDQGLRHLTAVCEAASHGDLEARVVALDTIPIQDEKDGAALASLQALGAAINHMLDMADAYVRESQGALEAARDGRFHRRFLKRGLLGTFANGARIINSASIGMKEEDEGRKERQKLADSFELEVRDLIERVASSASQANAAAKLLSDNAMVASQAATKATQSSEHIDKEVSSVTSNSTMVAQTAKNIANHSSLSLKSSSDAQDAANEVTESTKQLESEVRAIGSVISIIQDITFQTNILSLNAAVEAARAGDAGRGFAVVAEEVRNLAGRTAEATKTVEERIGSLKSSALSVISQIETIKSELATCSDVAQEIAGATDEQTAITSDFERSMKQISYEITQANDAMQASQQAADDTASAAEEVFAASADLEHTATELEYSLNAYLRALGNRSEPKEAQEELLTAYSG